jgi:hypothetical protein
MRDLLKIAFALICPLMITLPLYFGTVFMYLIDRDIMWIFLFIITIFCHMWISKFILGRLDEAQV